MRKLLCVLRIADQGVRTFRGDPGLRLEVEFGLDSLSRLDLVVTLEARLGVTVPDGDIGTCEYRHG
ncbi:MAG: acyl carrier protein [Pseudonocardiaceae bacterium]